MLIPRGGVTLQQTARRALAALMTKGPMSLRDLAEECDVSSSSTMAKHVNRLEELGLVSKGMPIPGKRAPQGALHATVTSVTFGGEP